MTPEERRRGIEVVLDERPELDLDELQDLLARAGVAVDEATLVEDLDILGYDVDDVTAAPVEAADLHEDADDGAAAAPLGAPLDADAHVDRQDDAVAGARPRAVLVMVAAAMVLVVIAIVMIVGGGDEDTDDPVATADDTEVARAGGDTDTTGPTEPVEVAPVGPGSDPALDVPETLTDDFERSDIGDFPGVSTWELLRGYFANTDGNLDVLGPPDDGVVVAAVDVGSEDVRAQVSIDRPASRAGLAFRIVDEQNMFVWARVPEVGSIVLYEVVDGLPEPVASSGYVPDGDGMPVLGINVVEDSVELLHEGVVVATYDDLPPAEGTTRIGLALLAGGEGLPLFDELRVLTP